MAVCLLVFVQCGWWSLVHAGILLLLGCVQLVDHHGWWQSLPLFGLALTLCALVQTEMAEERREWREVWCGIFSVVALLIAVTFFWREELRNVTTIGWGAASLLLVLGGFFLRSRPMRVVGFVGLGMAILRVFVVDIKDTFYRIIAFAVLAVLFLGLGYLYSRFRDQLRDS